MNNDKVQMSDILCLAIVTFLDEAIQMKLLLLPLGRYLFSMISGNRYLPRGGKEKFAFYYFHWEFACGQIGNIPSNHTIFGLCHDSLNSGTQRNSFKKNSNERVTKILLLTLMDL